MVEVQTPPRPVTPSAKPPSTNAVAAVPPPSLSLSFAHNTIARLRNHMGLDTYSSPVNQNGSFEFDRVIKSGYVQKRTQKTKVGRQPDRHILRQVHRY